MFTSRIILNPWVRSLGKMQIYFNAEAGCICDHCVLRGKVTKKIPFDIFTKCI
jgi:hypothetical protein